MTYKLSDSLKSIQVGTTTTTGTEHRARKLMPHATTVDPFTRSLWNTTIFDQLQDLFRSIGYSFYHISWVRHYCLLQLFPIRNPQHWQEVDLHSGHCTTGQPESVLCKLFAQMLHLLVENHTVLVLLLTSVFCAHSCWRHSVMEEHGALQP